MPEHVDPLHILYDLTRKCGTFLRGWLCSLIAKHSGDLTETPESNSLSEFSAKGQNRIISFMAHKDPIYIILSDSESETENELGVGKGLSISMIPAASTNQRKLPSWAKPNGIETQSEIVIRNGQSLPVACAASASQWNFPSRDNETESEIVMGDELSLPMVSAASTDQRKLPSWANPNRYGGSSRNKQLSETVSSSAPMLTNYNHPPEVKFQKESSSILGGTAQNQYIVLEDEPKLSTAKWDMDQRVNGVQIAELDSGPSSSYAHVPGYGYGSVSLQQTLKRSLPPSFQPCTSASKATAKVENGGTIKICDSHGTQHQSLGTNFVNHRVRTADNLAGRNNEDSVMYEPNGSRLLPSSLIHEKPFPTLQSTTSGGPAHHPGIEEGNTENDESLVYQAALQNLSQPKLETTLPDGLLAVPLLRHQKIALTWLYQTETTSVHCLGGILADDQGLGKTISMIALILLQKDRQLKSTADDLQIVDSEALNLDDDGLEKGNHITKHDEVKTIPKVGNAVPAFHKGRPAAGTLVVCPASVLRQWAREIDEKVTDSAKLSVLIYHGGTRTKDPLELARHDVVLTTYAIVANEVPKQPLHEKAEDKKDVEKYGLCSELSNNKKRKKASNANKKGKKGRKGIDNLANCCGGALAKVRWFRVILDEAHMIKNHRTQVARACCGLRAKRRWCLSGTSIQNRIDDLYSYFRFLKYDPYTVYKSFCYSIKFPISRYASQGYKKLQAVLKTIMLRRTKGTLLHGQPIISLPPKFISLVKVDFSAREREFYKQLEEDSCSKFKAYDEAGTVDKNYANILLMLLRLRQACDHPALVKEQELDFVGEACVEMASVEIARRLPRDLLIKLLDILEDPICSLCSDPPEKAVVTMCGHVFCYQCVADYLTGDDNLCPSRECREHLGADDVFAKATLRNCISDDLDGGTTDSSEGADSVLHNMYTSSKIRAALEILEKHCKPKKLCDMRILEGHNGSSYLLKSESCNFEVCEAANSTQAEKPVKAIVFSQWTGMLDLVEASLSHSCIQYRRLDGTMSLASRDRAVKEFNNDPEVTVMLMSLKAGNLGLNMVAACLVIMLDLWWNPTTEDQAVDRAHRIGQTRPVNVSRFTITDTVEDRILALQEQKREMVASAFGEDHKGGIGSRLTVEDLRYLFMGA